MALIYCPECGKEISDKSLNCVHCGCPANYYDKSKRVITKKRPKAGKPAETIVNKPDALPLRVQEYAEKYGISPASVYRHASEGTLPAHKIAGTIFIYEDEVKDKSRLTT